MADEEKSVFKYFITACFGLLMVVAGAVLNFFETIFFNILKCECRGSRSGWFACTYQSIDHPRHRCEA